MVPEYLDIFILKNESQLLSHTQMVKNLPAMQKTQVQALGWEEPLEKGMAKPLQYSHPENPVGRGTWQAYNP